MPIISDNRQDSGRISVPADVQWGVRIPMRDGISLNAMVFRPRGRTAPAPVVFEMTPYGIDAFYAGGKDFAAHGLNFVLIDSRGRGDSGGEFEMFEVDVNDTVDAIDWLSRQAWCDGQVAMYGGSYSGANQWTAAKACHPALKTITPWGAGCMGVDVNAGGIPFIGHLSWHLLTSGRDTYWQMSADSGYWADLLAMIYRENRSAAELPRLAGILRPKFEQALRDPYYALKSMSTIPTEDELRRIDLPILSSTGHYDSTHPGTLFHFKRFEQYASEEARRKHYLVIGPWHHAGMDGTDAVGALAFAPQAKVDMAAVRYEWFKWAFGIGDKPAFLQHRIMYYMAGAEEWRGCDTLEEAFSTKKSFFMSSDGGANDLFHSGRLHEDERATPPDRYYRLLASAEAAPAVVPAGPRPTVAVAAVSVPEIVDRPQIVTLGPGSEVRLSEQHRWAEPLKLAIGRLVADHLSQALGGALVSAYPAEPAADTAYRVSLNVQRSFSIGTIILVK